MTWQSGFEFDEPFDLAKRFGMNFTQIWVLVQCLLTNMMKLHKLSGIKGGYISTLSVSEVRKDSGKLIKSNKTANAMQADMHRVLN